MVGVSVSVGTIVQIGGGGGIPIGVRHATIFPQGLGMEFAPNVLDGSPDGEFPTTPPIISTGGVGSSPNIIGQPMGMGLGTPTISITGGGGINTPTLLGSVFDPAGAPSVSELSVNIVVPTGVSQQALVAAISLRSANTTADVTSVIWTPDVGSPQQLARQGVVERHTTNSAPEPFGTGTRITTIWGLLNPITGSGVLRAVFSAPCNSSRFAAYSAANVAQFGPVETAQDTAAEAVGPATVTAQAVSENSTFLAAVRFINGGAAPFTPVAGTTELFDTETSDIPGGFDNDHGFTDVAKQGGAIGVPVTLATAASVARSWGMSAIELRRTIEQTEGPGATGIYFVHTDGKIYDPSGNVYRIIGTCIEHNKLPASTNLIYLGTPGWGLNKLRVLDLTTSTSLPSNHQSISDAYLAAGKSINWSWAEVGGFATTGGAGRRNLTTVTNWLTAQANIYGTGKSKANEAYWYSFYNEAGSFNDNTDASLSGGQIVWNASRVATWKTMISACIAAVRNTGARAPIIIPALVGGGDVPRFSNGNAFNFPVGERSSILKFAADILAAAPNVVGNNGAVTKNLIFAFHLYDRYNTATFNSSAVGGNARGDQAKLAEFFAEANARGINILIEEFGLVVATTVNTVQSMRNMHALREEYGGHHFGQIVWQWDGNDPNNLTTTNTGCPTPAGSSTGIDPKCGTCDYAASITKRCSGPDVDSLTTPTNLTASGKALWDATHPGTFPPPLDIS